MSSGTRSQSRKRERQSDSELNLSIQPTVPKIRRYFETIKEMPNTEPNSSNFPFTDLSGTIIVGGQRPDNASNQAQNNGVTNESLNNAIRENVAVNVDHSAQMSLEDEVKKMRNEMSAIKKMMSDLTIAFKNVSVNNTPESHGIRNNDNNNANDNYSPNIARAGSSFSANHPSEPAPNSFAMANNANFNREQVRIRIDKLGIQFDGNTSRLSVEDFIFRLEHVQAQYSIPWGEVIRDFHLLLTDRAEQWYWLYLKNRVSTDWPSLRHALLEKYQTMRSNFELVRDLTERKQQHNESIDSYFHVMGQLRSRLLQAISEYDMIKILKRNVKESVGRIIYPMTVSSVEQLRIECNEAERNFPRRDMRIAPQHPQPSSRTTKYVSEMYAEEPEYEELNYYSPATEEVAAVNLNTQSQRTMKCWNCGSLEHLWMVCPAAERTIFCYRCGKPGTTVPKCPKCSLENQSRGVGYKGGPRPSENPVAKN